MAELNITAEPGKQEITFTRVFDAPRELVFRAWMDPELIPQWLGPRRLSMTVVEMDARRGGSWCFVHRDADGNEYGFRGVHHDVVPPERVVRTFEFEGMPGHVQLETLALEDFEGKTRVRGQAVFQSQEARDGELNSGMEAGLSESFDRLDELLKQLRHR